jgi:hypothetical protein
MHSLVRFRGISPIALCLILLVPFVAAGAADDKPADHGIFNEPDKLQWQAGPPSLAPGAKVVVLEGDPTKEGVFTMRLRFPDGFEIKPHWHPAVEHVTVLSGALNLGMGDAFDKTKTKAVPAGGFAFMPPKMHHFAWAKGDTIIQLHGIGPWQVNYLDPADDPRKKQ